MLLLVLNVFLLFLFGSQVLSIQFQSNESTINVAFGSCSKPYLKQWAWEKIQHFDPDLWVWLGDVVYVDKKIAFNVFVETNLSFVKSQFNLQKNREDYSRFISGVSDPKLKIQGVIGIWDDHDFGLNDGDRHFVSKERNKKIFLDFLDEPLESPRWNQQGLYMSYDFISNFNGKSKKMKIILLDNRYTRDKHSIEDPEKSILGVDQWAWLESELRNSDADVHLICSGIQVIPDDRNQFAQLFGLSKHSTESWGLFPYDRQRLIETLAEYRTPGAVLLSGDVHFAEESVLKCSRIGYPLYELTSSGLTHTWKRSLAHLFSGQPIYTQDDAELPYWVGNVISIFLMKILFFIVPGRFNEQIYTGLNFGMVSVDWERMSLSLLIHGHGEYYDPVISHTITLSDLVYDPDYQNSFDCTPHVLSQSEKKSFELSFIPLMCRVFALACFLALTLAVLGVILDIIAGLSKAKRKKE